MEQEEEDRQETQVPKYWREEHLPTAYVQDQCAFLDELFGCLLERDIQPKLAGWQDRLRVAIRNQGHDVAELVHKLTQTISTRRGDVLVPSLQAWALALDRSGFVDEKKYDKLIKYNTGEKRALHIVVCMLSASRYIKMVVVKQGVEVRMTTTTWS